MRTTSKTPSAQAKKRIQALLRELVIKRDGGCVLRDYEQTGECGGYAPKAGHLILQAEHLVSRARSVSYGDPRNVICLCQRHHGYWKEQNSRLYWEIVQDIIGPDRWAYVKRVEADHKPYPMATNDWLKVEVALKQDIKQPQ